MINVDKYHYYTIEDFVWDDKFREWVLYPNPAVSEFWAGWLLKYPEKEPVIQQAREVVAVLKATPHKISEQRKHEIIAGTLGRINAPVLTPVFSAADMREAPARRINRLRYGLGIAAAFLLILAGAWFMAYNMSGRNRDYSYEALVKRSGVKLMETSNTSSGPLVIRLSDGSSVTLEKNARISYAPSFSGLDKREVYLSGDAFFDIQKNPSKPFSVYANEVVTKVLGTSFKVKTDLTAGKVTVEVLTGRVEVYEQRKAAVKPGSRRGNGVILTPNQKVVYSAEKDLFESTLVDDPIPIVKKGNEKAKRLFLFEDTPLSEVIKDLEATYGIEVEVENEAIYNCRFTGDISEQNLYRKLDALCQSTKTSYEIKETKIFIKGKGCD